MAQTYRSRQLRLEREIDRLFGSDMAELARLIARLLLLYGVFRDGRQIIPNQRLLREAISAAIWTQMLKPYFIGRGGDPFNGPNPLSPFARLIYNGVKGGIEITAEQQQAVIRQAARGADDVLRYLTQQRPVLGTAPPVTLRGFYDPFHLFVDPNGYKLSDRVWRDAIGVRSRINKLLDYHISRGTAAVDIADELERFLTPGAAVQFTNTPYGREGSYAARRLARTEITAAAGRATVNASIANPFVDGVKWALSASHPCCDICDDYAAGGENGDGVYPPEAVPGYPAHPHEMCGLLPLVTMSRAEVIARIRADMRSERRLQGLFNREFMTGGLLNGFYDEAVGAAVSEMAVIYA